MAKTFSAELKDGCAPIWRAIENHPFLVELHAGTLPMERFTYFILQDYVYLLDFAQVLCLGGAKSPDLATLELFCRHALGAVEVERTFHANFGKTHGLSQRELDKVAKAPATQAYIDHLQSVARGGTLGELVAAVLPCYWIYGEAGKRLTETARAVRRSIANGSRLTRRKAFGSRCVNRFNLWIGSAPRRVRMKSTACQRTSPLAADMSSCFGSRLIARNAGRSNTSDR